MAPIEIAHGDTRATVLPELGMLVASFSCEGRELLALPHSVDDYARTGSATAVPLLFPWANRLDGLRYSVRGRTVDLSGASHLLQFNAGLPIHGALPSLLAMAVVDQGSDELAAVLEPASDDPLMQVFPFAHRLGIRVHVGPSALTLQTRLAATGDEPVPVAFGYHPYLALPEGDRDDWSVSVSAREHLLLDDRLLPTGGAEPADLQHVSLRGRTFDDGYADLGPTGTMSVAGAGHTLTVAMEEGYTHAQVYAPAGARFVALEPMTAPANALVTGTGLRHVQPGHEFVARFTITLS